MDKKWQQVFLLFRFVVNQVYFLYSKRSKSPYHRPLFVFVSFENNEDDFANYSAIFIRTNNELPFE